MLSAPANNVAEAANTINNATDPGPALSVNAVYGCTERYRKVNSLVDNNVQLATGSTTGITLA